MILRVKSGQANSLAAEQEGDESAERPAKKGKARKVETPAREENEAQPENNQPVAMSEPELNS